MTSRMGYRASVFLTLFLLIIAGSFAGTIEVLEISKECADGIDNDGDLNAIDGGIDVEDAACFVYPFNDGNGETVTPIQARYTSAQEYPSLFDYHRNYGNFYTVCDAYGLGYYDQFPEQKAEANTWLDAQGQPRFGCPP